MRHNILSGPVLQMSWNGRDGGTRGRPLTSYIDTTQEGFSVVADGPKLSFLVPRVLLRASRWRRSEYGKYDRTLGEGRGTFRD